MATFAQLFLSAEQVAMSTTCALANDAAQKTALSNSSLGSRSSPDEEKPAYLKQAEHHGCVMANISAQWLGHFDYRPVIEPEVVWPQLALAKPNLLWHPVKASKPLSSNLLDKAYGKIPSDGSQEVHSNHDSKPNRDRGPNLTLLKPTQFMRSILEKPRSYKPLEYFLSGTHVPWS